MTAGPGHVPANRSPGPVRRRVPASRMLAAGAGVPQPLPLRESRNQALGAAERRRAIIAIDQLKPRMG